MSDMTHDTFATFPFGKAALEKMAPTPANFRLYKAENMGPGSGVMKVKGAEFRIAERGPNKGKLSVLLPGTVKTVLVTLDEIRAHEPATN
ncbi:hypothetical protein [Aeromonas caviae]|uniref:hypothetical protein n=1 Tax=Aeromonas caviae TaxID=648 RepID=UPI001CC81A1C|nr:hypothetical protein [Aeromonas caviae]GJA77777.1 hypothetical protein KAM354_30130 [Aeromonas caviae]HDT5889294.1 hypothetical protein [Aeromonas dhakensis]HEB4980319.1 hypothetical protein [Aeromonas dhakensis]